MKRTFIIAPLLAAMMCGCGTIDATRPAQTLQIQVNADQPQSYQVYKAGNHVRTEVPNRDGIHQLDLPAIRYGGMLVLFFPVIHDPEKDEFVVITRDGKELATMSIAKVRRMRTDEHGVIQIRTRAK